MNLKRIDGTIIKRNISSIKDACEEDPIVLSGADLSGADLFRANLSRADLSGANLFKADLSGTNLSGTNLTEEIKIKGKCKVYNLVGMKYNILIFLDDEKKILKIGCECHLLSQWKKFTDKDIYEMGSGDKDVILWGKCKYTVFNLADNLHRHV